MNVTATLIGQIGTFAVLIWFVMRFLWQPVIKVLEDRQKRIADGLAAAEQGQRDKELAEEKAAEALREARVQATEIIAQAQRRGDEIVEESKQSARVEGERLITAAKAEIEQELNRAKEDLRKEVVIIAVAGAERLLGREINQDVHRELLEELAESL